MESSFYSTSLSNTGRPIGSVYCTTDSIAARLSPPVSVGRSVITAPGATAPKQFYTTAYQPGAASMPEGADAVAYFLDRPEDDTPPVGGQDDNNGPVGDAVLPLLACMLVYGAWKLRRMFRFTKK